MTSIDHPIFNQSVQFIREKIGATGLEALEQDVLERLIHSSGDFNIQSFLKFSPNSCSIGVSALQAGAPILTDTLMAASAVAPMASRTLNSEIYCALDWAPDQSLKGLTRSAIGIENAWKELTQQFRDQQSPVVLIGSAPTALYVLLEMISKGFQSPSLIIGMPVGFINVIESKTDLAKSNCPNIRLDGNRGGAGLAASVINSLLKEAFKIKNTLDQ